MKADPVVSLYANRLLSGRASIQKRPLLSRDKFVILTLKSRGVLLEY